MQDGTRRLGSRVFQTRLEEQFLVASVAQYSYSGGGYRHKYDLGLGLKYPEPPCGCLSGDISHKRALASTTVPEVGECGELIIMRDCKLAVIKKWFRKGEEIPILCGGAQTLRRPGEIAQ